MNKYVMKELKLQLGVQSQNTVEAENPLNGFMMMKRAGFISADFSLHAFLKNKDIYGGDINSFFDADIDSLKEFFAPYKSAAKEAGVVFGQMHMPYPLYVPLKSAKYNAYLRKEVAPKSLELCAFLECPYIVIHGFKLTRLLGSEEAEWRETEKFLSELAPRAKELGVTMCVENLYDSLGGHIVEGPCCNAKKCADRIDRMNETYGAEVLGFCFDTGHANLIGIDFEEFICIMGSRLKVLHIHDNDGIADLHQIPYTFAKTRENKSSTDWEGFLKGLKAVKYEGILNFETGPVLTSFPDELKEETLKFIAKIGKYFADEIEKR